MIKFFVFTVIIGAIAHVLGFFDSEFFQDLIDRFENFVERQRDKLRGLRDEIPEDLNKHEGGK